MDNNNLIIDNDHFIDRRPTVVVNLRNANDDVICEGQSIPLSMTFKEFCDRVPFPKPRNDEMFFVIREEDRKIMDYDRTFGEENIEPGTQLILAYEGEEIENILPPQIQLEIKELFSPDVALLPRWKPVRTDDIYLPIQLTIGAKNREEEAIFYFVLATPNAFIRKLQNSWENYVIVQEKFLFIVQNYQWNQFHQNIDNIVKSCRARYWNDCISNLHSIFRDNQ